MVSVTDDDTWETVLDAEVSVLEAHAESVMASGTEAARAMEQIREEFTIRHATASPESVPRERPRTQAVVLTNSATILARRSPCCS